MNTYKLWNLKRKCQKIIFFSWNWGKNRPKIDEKWFLSRNWGKKIHFQSKIWCKNWRNCWKIRFIKSKLGQKWKKVGNFFLIARKKSIFGRNVGKKKKWAKIFREKKCPKNWFLTEFGAKMAKNGREIKKIAKIGGKKI